MPTQETIERLGQAVNAVTLQNVDRLVSRPDWGPIDFQDCREVFEDGIALVRPLQDLPLRLLPENVARSLADAVNAFAEHLKLINDFRINSGGDPNQRRGELANAVRGLVDRLYTTISPHAAFLALQRGDIDKSVRDLAQARKDAEHLITEGKAHLETQMSEIASIMTQAREAAASVGIAHFSTDFDKEAGRLDRGARGWLGGAAIFGAAAGALAALSFFYFRLPADASYAQITQHTISKLVLLGLFVSATFWCARMYRALKHQAAINRHRANALKTFQAFVKAAADDMARDAVLMETTRSIFALTPSGYLGEPEASSADGMKIVELIRNTTTGGARA